MGGSARDRRADFDTQRFADQPFKFCRVPAGSPQLELRVARGAELQQTIIPPIVHFKAGNRLRVAAVEAFGQPQDGGEGTDGFPALFAEIAVDIVAALGRRLPVIARDEADDVDFFRLEAA
jgi:hypothetical protein